MTYEADIFRAIKSCGAAWHAIGGRFAWDIADNDFVAPYIVAQTVSDDVPSATSPTGSAAFPTLQLSCWAESKIESRNIINTIVDAITGHDLPGDSQTSLTLDSITSTFDTDSRLFGCVARFRASIQFA